jgi:hypothetical protein
MAKTHRGFRFLAPMRHRTPAEGAGRILGTWAG